MRTIKFRAWDKERNEMCEVTEWRIGGTIAVKTTPESPDHVLNSNDYELMQFTGLLDKNGKEIYEGDIATYQYVTYLVEWIKEDCKFWLHSHEGRSYKEITSFCEVIGNIYESPDLLTPPQKRT